jgi:hypothetical protein
MKTLIDDDDDAMMDMRCIDVMMMMTMEMQILHYLL